MSRATRISRHRRVRQQRQARGGQAIGRAGAVVVIAVGLLGALALAGALTAVTALYANLTADMPDPSVAETAVRDGEAFAVTRLFARGADRDGDGRPDPVLIDEIADPLGDARRWLSLDDVAAVVVDATLAYSRGGVDDGDLDRISLPDLARLVNRPESDVAGVDIADYLVQATRGGVTSDARTLTDRLMAQRLQQTYPRRTLLTWYLNTAYYGRLAYGIEAAAGVYFDKPAAALTLPEAAMLAGLPEAPAENPFDDLPAARRRQQRVLVALESAGRLDREGLIEAQFTVLDYARPAAPDDDHPAPHFSALVRRELESRLGPDRLLREGLRVFTTLDLALQRQARCVAAFQVTRLAARGAAAPATDELAACPALAHLPPLPAADTGFDFDVDNAAVVAIDPATGEIVALVGQLDPAGANLAVDGRRQPGSALQPFIYLTALSQGYAAATMLLDVPTDFGTPYNGVPYQPENGDGAYHGPLQMRAALASGYNVPAVEVMTWVGVDNVIRTARNLGITTLDQPANSYGLSLASRGGELNVLDIAYAFSVLANEGVMVGRAPQAGPGAAERSPDARPVDPVAIAAVEDADGRVILGDAPPQERVVVSRELAFIINDILADRGARCAALGCPNALELPDNRPAAAVTGDTASFRDAWTIGYTPQLAVAVWLGNDDHTPMSGLTGLKGAAPIWQALMSWALAEAPARAWERPPGLREHVVCTPSGLLPTPHCPTITEYFVEGTAPTVYDSIYQALRVNRETGRLATIYTPPELIDSRVYPIYPERAAEWVAEAAIEQPPTEFDTIDAPPTQSGEVAITSPRPFTYVRGPVEIIGNAQSEQFAYYRLAYFEGLDPVEVKVLADNITEPKENRVLGIIDASRLSGLVTLLLTVVQADGSFVEESVHIIVDNTPPSPSLTGPRPGERVLLSAGEVALTAEATDDTAVRRVEFFVDEVAAPFAVDETPPYTAVWPVRRTGCHLFSVRAVDAAGNVAQTSPQRTCVVDR